jgi:hypothetical protein
MPAIIVIGLLLLLFVKFPFTSAFAIILTTILFARSLNKSSKIELLEQQRYADDVAEFSKRSKRLMGEQSATHQSRVGASVCGDG